MKTYPRLWLGLEYGSEFQTVLNGVIRILITFFATPLFCQAWFPTYFNIKTNDISGLDRTLTWDVR